MLQFFTENTLFEKLPCKGRKSLAQLHTTIYRKEVLHAVEPFSEYSCNRSRQPRGGVLPPCRWCAELEEDAQKVIRIQALHSKRYTLRSLLSWSGVPTSCGGAPSRITVAHVAGCALVGSHCHCTERPVAALQRLVRLVNPDRRRSQPCRSRQQEMRAKPEAFGCGLCSVMSNSGVSTTCSRS